ncbi:MAG: hypothetical protein KTR27_05545 [Leptolyngbyaceae cyanobacterium MAG.088]|nr:hypothetical protein [Leptolyngbyaceae cyanobacterium MAG.088]
MTKLYTALVQPKYHQLRYAFAILVGYSVGGFYLSSCQASAAIWSVICLLVAYIAITGMAGVVLSEACFSGMVIIYALSYPWPITKALSIPFTPAQIWSMALLIFWLLGSLLIFLLGSAITEFAQQRRFYWRYTVCLGGLSFLALHLGHRVYVTVTF